MIVANCNGLYLPNYSDNKSLAGEAAMTYPHTPCMRRDSNLTELVQFGIALQEISGRAEAHHFMIVRGIQPSVIERVLSHPEQRRIIERKAEQRPNTTSG